MRYHQPPELYGSLEKAEKFETERNKLTFESEIENIYLLGDFTVRHTGRSESLPRAAERLHGTFSLGASALGKEIDGRDLVRAGFPFFAGRITLRQEFELTAEEAAYDEGYCFVTLGVDRLELI